MRTPTDLNQALIGTSSLYPPVDIVAGLNDIENKLQNGYYKNEYDFQYDIWSVVASSHDFHEVYAIDIITVFNWQREHQLVSLSTDGIELPSIYVYSDIVASNGSGTTPSPVVKINDMDVETWLNNQAGLTPWGHDPDGNYNNVLWSATQMNQGNPSANGTYALATRPQSSLTKLTFADGREWNDHTYATSNQNFTGVVDGSTFFAKFCTGERVSPDFSIPTQTTPDNTNSSAPANSTSPASFTAVSTQTTATPCSTVFPTPLVLTSDLSLAGYLPADLPDTAVLQIPSFDPEDPVDFQSSVRGLLATAQSQGRKKLIVDLRSNGGGRVALGYDTFSVIFPSILPYGGSNIRSTPLFRNITLALMDYFANRKATDAVPDALQSFLVFSPYDFKDNVNSNGTQFSSAQEFYGPYRHYDDDFTAIQRQKASNDTSSIPQVFQPDDIVLLQDGLCGSTCAIFAEFMKSQAHVKTIAVGGRKQDGPMQGVGGSKGAEVVAFSAFSIAANAAAAVANSTIRDAAQGDATDLNLGAAALATRTTGGTGVTINFRNNIRQGDSSYTPLQYVYEAADCRFFYTAPMLSNQMLVYKMVYDIHWRNASCVPGSAGHPSSLSGSLLSYIDAYPPPGANYTFNAPDQPWPSNVSIGATTNSTATPSIAPTSGLGRLASSTTYLGTTSTVVSTKTAQSSSTAVSSALPSQTANSMAPLHCQGCGVGAFIAAGLALQHLLS